MFAVDSRVLSTDHWAQLCEWIDRGDGGHNERYRPWQLLYRATRDSFEARAFHEVCGPSSRSERNRVSVEALERS